MKLVKRVSPVLPALAALVALSFGLSLHAAAAPGPNQSRAGVFATDPGGVYAASHGPAGVAAIVDGHPILLRDVMALCLCRSRAPIIDQMVQDYVLERACTQAGIVVSPAEVDTQIAALRRVAAPQTLEAVLARHQTSMDTLREAVTHKIQRRKLVAGQVPKTKMVHCRAILIRYAPPGAPLSVAGTTRTEAEALALITTLQSQIRAGKDFGTLAGKVSEADPKPTDGDFGVVYSGIHNTDPAAVEAAVTLGTGAVSQPVKSYSGYWLLQAVSTDADFQPAEAAAYRAAQDTYEAEQSQFLSPPFIVGLIDRSHLTFATDAACSPPPGQALPAAAATVDDHVIPLPEVAAKCLAADGPRTVDVLVQNYLVDQECRRRHIIVPASEIDRRIAALTKRIAPHTLAEGLRARHMTEADLRYDFQQDQERVLLVADQVQAPAMTHCRAVPSGTHAAGSDLGILYPGQQNRDTSVLTAGLALGFGETTAVPIQAATGPSVLHCLSTSSSHPKSEDAAYAAALTAYQEQQAQTLTPQAVIALIKKSHVIYYVHA